MLSMDGTFSLEEVQAVQRSVARMHEHELVEARLREKGTDIGAANLSAIRDLWITKHQSVERIVQPGVTMPALNMLVLVGRMDVWTPEFLEKVRGIQLLRIMDSPEARLDFPHKSLLQLRQIYLDNLPNLVDFPQDLTRRVILNVKVKNCPLLEKEGVVGDFLASMSKLPDLEEEAPSAAVAGEKEVKKVWESAPEKTNKSKACVVQ